jgi:hypothetical protein
VKLVNPEITIRHSVGKLKRSLKMNKENLTDEAVATFKQFLSERDVSNYQSMTREQFENIKLRFNTCKPDLNREMCKKLGVPFLGDLSYEEYVVAAAPPVVFDDDGIDYDNLSAHIDAQKAAIKGKPCILCESKKTKANLIKLDDYHLCLPLCNKCFKRDGDIKAWAEEYKLLLELNMEFDTAHEILERMLKTLPKLTAAMNKAIGFEADELAICGFKKVEPDDAPLKKLTSDASTEICLRMFQKLMGLMQKLEPQNRA